MPRAAQVIDTSKEIAKGPIKAVGGHHLLTGTSVLGQKEIIVLNKELDYGGVWIFLLQQRQLLFRIVSTLILQIDKVLVGKHRRNAIEVAKRAVPLICVKPLTVISSRMVTSPVTW